MFKRIATAMAIATIGLLAGTAQAKPPMEAFGDMPSIRAVELSPDGSRAVYILRESGVDVLVIHDFATKTGAALARVDEIRARDVQFVGNDYVVLIASKDTSTFGYRGRFECSGYGQWGRKMQDDITDGARALATMGWTDPNRVCIVGWSYGGYAALAGGALTPDMYKCVASIAGVSNLRDMLTDTRSRYGFRSPSFTYWQLLIGDLEKDGDAIDAVSPSRLAENFAAPVLLIHGEADTVVPIKQSDMMNNALRGAKKTVRFVRVPGDDHSLVENDSRRLALTELATFLKTHIGQ